MKTKKNFFFFLNIYTEFCRKVDNIALNQRTIHTTNSRTYCIESWGWYRCISAPQSVFRERKKNIAPYYSSNIRRFLSFYHSTVSSSFSYFFFVLFSFVSGFIILTIVSSCFPTNWKHKMQTPITFFTLFLLKIMHTKFFFA